MDGPNINSPPNKIDALRTLISNNLDILVVEETEIDDTSSDESIKHKAFRRDRKRGGSGIIAYIREDIPSKALNLVSIPDDIEGIFIEINLRKAKWLISATYLPLGKIKVIISITFQIRCIWGKI